MITTHRILLVDLAALAFGASLVTAKTLFPLYSINHDEPMYVIEAQLLEQGHLTASARQADFFDRGLRA